MNYEGMSYEDKIYKWLANQSDEDSRFKSLEEAVKNFKENYPDLADVVDDKLNVIDERLKLSEYIVDAKDENEAKETEEFIKGVVRGFKADNCANWFLNWAETEEEAWKADFFQFSYSEQFACHEAGKTPRFLTAEQSEKLRRKYARSRELNRLRWELGELSWSIHIEGFTGRDRKPVNLVEWATGRAAMLPTPYEDLVLDPLEEEPEETYEERYNQRCEEIHRLFKKYVKGLTFLSEEADEADYTDEDEILTDSARAMDCAEIGFQAWIEGISFAFGWLNRDHADNDKVPWYELTNIIKAQGVVEYFTDRKITKRLGRRRIEDWPDTAPQLMAVRNAERIFHNSDREKIKREIVYQEKRKAETVEKWMREVERRDGKTIGENSKKLTSVPVN